MTEATLSKKIAKRIRDRGGWARKVHGGPNGSGWPDIVGTYRGHFLGLETKLPGKERNVTQLQAETLKGIAAAGGVARVVTSVGQVDRLLDRIDALYGPE